MTTPDEREQRARDMLRPYGEAMSPSQLAGLLSYRTTAPVLGMIRRGEFVAIDLGGGRYSIPTETLTRWLASRLTTVTEEDK